MPSLKTFKSEPSVSCEPYRAPLIMTRETTMTTKKPNIESFMEETRSAFEDSLDLGSLMTLSTKLQEQFKEKLQASEISMLPSYNHTLPTGEERGSYLALDVGGTNFRVALVQLNGRPGNGKNGMRIVKMVSHQISGPIRDLKGREFFAWMAERIEEALADAEIIRVHRDKILPMGVAWSFPIEQTCVRSGRILTMGKEFRAADGIVGEDLTGLIMDACKNRNLNVRMDALINDGSATLLSSAYNDPNTKFGLILGTGTNASVMLPCSAIHTSKFGTRSASWHAQAQEVLVNTEYSMFGKGALPTTRWDAIINSTHSQPDFQPYEQLIGGGYLGEIFRLVLVDAIGEAGLLGGIVPIGLRKPYALDTGVLAALARQEPDYTRILSFLAMRPSAPALEYIRTIAALISDRACALLAAAVHALWQLRLSSQPSSISWNSSPVAFACNGSVIERYPGFLARTQNHVSQLLVASGADSDAVVLEIAEESALFGAAVAVSCVEGL